VAAAVPGTNRNSVVGTRHQTGECCRCTCSGGEHRLDSALDAKNVITGDTPVVGRGSPSQRGAGCRDPRDDRETLRRCRCSDVRICYLQRPTYPDLDLLSGQSEHRHRGGRTAQSAIPAASAFWRRSASILMSRALPAAIEWQPRGFNRGEQHP
jgi:hypothetical protein